MALDINYYKKKDARSLSFSILFLISVLLMTLGLFFYNSYLETKNIRSEEDLAQKQLSIDELRKDKSIDSYFIYSQNKEAFQKLEKYSRISPMVEHLIGVMVGYDLVFNSFSYAKGKVTLQAYAESADNGLAYKKIVKFIQDYNSKEDSLFQIDNISEYTGQDKIEFPLSFELQ